LYFVGANNNEIHLPGLFRFEQNTNEIIVNKIVKSNEKYCVEYYRLKKAFLTGCCKIKKTGL
jgi:hypothetical protein